MSYKQDVGGHQSWVGEQSGADVCVGLWPDLSLNCVILLSSPKATVHSISHAKLCVFVLRGSARR